MVSKKDKVTDMNNIQLKLKVRDTYGKDRKLTTNIKPTDDSKVINKSYMDEKLSKIDGHLSLLEKDYNDFKLQCNKESEEEILIQRAMKTTIQKMYEKGLFDGFPNADEVLKDLLFVTRSRGYLKKKK